MARKPKDKPVAPEAEERPERKAQKDLLTKVRDCHKKLVEDSSEQENRRQALSDMEFLHVPGKQWDADQKKKRGKRPCYELNISSTRAMRVINDMRANRAQGKVRGFEDGDKDTAETIEGLIRNICNQSDFDAVQDYAAGYQVGGGMGAWRVETKYTDDSTFDQDIGISRIANPFCLYLTDDEAIYVDSIPNEEYERRWPKSERTDFDEDEFSTGDDWQDEHETRVCEYWYKVPVKRELWLLTDGRTVDAEAEKGKIPTEAIKAKRVVDSYKIRMCIASGSAILEERDWLGKFIPFVQAFGQKLILDGKTVWYGLVRNGKDAARGHNTMYTAAVESVMNAPKAPYIASFDQLDVDTLKKWSQAIDENLPVLPYNFKPGQPPPMRVGGADLPAAYTQMLGVSEQALNSVLGIHEASLGEQGDEKSGRAIVARQQQGELATFNFKANMAEAVRRTWDILVDLIPKIYTNERSIRILGADGAEKYVKVNQVQLDAASLQAKPVNDLTRGKYDVTITVGPSYATQRMETLEVMLQMTQANPGIWGVAGDIIAQMLDSPKSEALAERLRTMLPPQIQQQIASGKPLPAEAQAAINQANATMAQVEQMAAVVQEAKAEADQSKAEAEKAKANVDTAIAKLQTEEARFEAYIAQKKAELLQQELQTKAEGMEADQGRGEERDHILSDITQRALEFQEQAADVLRVVLGQKSRADEAQMLAQQLMEEQAMREAQQAEMDAADKPISIVRNPDGSFTGSSGDKRINVVRDADGSVLATSEGPNGRKQFRGRRNPNGGYEGVISTIQ
jgi:hypothetical protein